MNDKQRIAEHAAAAVESGMLIGLGTGSTANAFIEALAQRVRDEGLTVETVASSVVSTLKARQCGLRIRSIEHIGGLDLYVDGADEVAPDLTLLKGRGADLVKEKLLAKAAGGFWVLAEAGKFVGHIGERYPIPIEVIPFAWQLVKADLEKAGGRCELRHNPATDGLIVTSHGSLVLDTVFEGLNDVHELNRLINNTPGVVEHGIFTGLSSAVITVTDGALQEIRATGS